MDYTSLREISETIIAIIQDAVDPTESVMVRPEILSNNRNGVGFYLFHVKENPHNKNLLPPGNSSGPIRFSPMALDLYYQLSANWRENDIEDAYEEQSLMSAAMKALHDNPELFETADGKKIRIRITLQTLSPSESVQYWAASESSVKLSAYYEVSVVFMEPDKVKSYTGRVLSYGNFIFLAGPPQITSTNNIIEFTDPLLNTRQVRIEPAQLPPTNVNPAPINSIANIDGSGFAGGALDVLLIRSFGAQDNKYLTIDATWNLTIVNQNKIILTVRQTATSRTTGAAVPLVPGLYSIQVVNTKQQTLPDGTVKDFRQSSNQFPLAVMPQITGIVQSGANTFDISGFSFLSADITSKEVEVYVGNDAFFENPLDPNDPVFTMLNNSTIQIDTTNIGAGVKPLRVIVNGIESEPKWITVP